VLRLQKLITLLRVATIEEERGGGEGGGEGETRNSRIHVFLSSIFSSLGGVFGSNLQESDNITTMASRAVIAPIEQNQPRGLFFLFLSYVWFDSEKLKIEGDLVVFVIRVHVIDSLEHVDLLFIKVWIFLWLFVYDIFDLILRWNMRVIWLFWLLGFIWFSGKFWFFVCLF